MRKLLLFTVILCYLASATGVILQWHYCMGQLQTVKLGISAHSDDTCDNCGMEKAGNSCCKDDLTVSKISDDHSLVSFFLIKQLLVPEIAFYCLSGLNTDLSLRAKPVFVRFESPPDPVRIRQSFLCVFRC